MLLRDYCLEQLEVWQTKKFYRKLQLPRPGISFSTNQYLGKRFGAGASRLMRASSNQATALLEDLLAKWKKVEAALVFPTGYMANLGVISALMGQEDLIILDKNSHASLIDGAYLSRAKLRVFKHNDVSDLEDILQKSKATYKKILVITEAVFSMDGDLAPLKEIYALTREHEVWLLVDEAHALGVFGERGNGLASALGLHEVEIITGTLSKAIGGLGGYVAGSRELKKFLINRARAFIYTTALPEIVIKKNICGLKKMNDRLQKKLWQNIDYFYVQAKKYLDLPKPLSAIVPLIIGDEEEALQRSQDLEKKGFVLPAVRYPTVPKGQARLRITITADQTKRDIDRLINSSSTANAVPLPPPSGGRPGWGY